MPRTLYERTSCLCAVLVTTLGIAVLIGWMLDIAALKSVLPGWETMKANTAIGFLLAGGSLLAADQRSVTPARNFAQFAMAGLVSLLGVLSVGEYVLDVDFGIDQLFFSIPANIISTTPPGRMALATALGLTFTGLALLFLDRRGELRIFHFAPLIGILIGILGLLGYSYDVSALYGVKAYSSVALHTAAALVAVNVGVILARPQRGMMAVVSSDTIGGVMARRLLPFALLAPFGIGWLHIRAQQLGLVSSEFGIAMVQLTYIILFSVLIWRTAERLGQSDQRRLAAEQVRHHRQAVLDGIFNSAMDGMIMVDSAQRVVLFNPAAEHMFGRLANEVVGTPLNGLLPQRFLADHNAHIQAFGRTGVASRRMGTPKDITGLRANGQEFPIDASISQLDVNGGKYFTVILRDVTERKRAEEGLRTAMAVAESANNAKSRFLAAASHDLRQPLAALSLYTDLLKKTSVPSERKVVANMQVCIESLNELLNDLLDLSKLEAGVVTPAISDFSIVDVFDSLRSLHAPEAAIRGLRLRFVPSTLTGRTDPVLFRRLLGNLIENALRYTERGGVVVACRKRLGKTWVEVWDTGVGIPADKTREIFEEFKQLGDQARNNGSGLGLAIVDKTATLLGLNVSVRSRLGRGSVFAIELPLGTSALTVPAPMPPAHVSRPLRIALVEDNEIVREALVVILHRLGHQVLATATGAALLAELDLFEPDIVVSDYRLTNGDTGLDVITAVRARLGPEFPALLITGDTDPKLLRSMNDRGIFVMHKSLQIDALQATLEQLTDRTN